MITFFAAYLRWLMRRSFSTIWLARDAAPLPRGGYVAAPNHSSWWDGFVAGLFHRFADPARPFGVMMSEEELRRFPFFRALGAFAVDAARPRSAYRSVIYASEQARHGAGVWIFPEGAIARGARRIPFARGFLLAARRAGVPVVPVAIRYAMRDRQRPEVFVHVGEPVYDGATASAVEATVRRLVAEIDARIERDEIDRTFTPVLRERPGIDTRIGSFLKLVVKR